MDPQTKKIVLAAEVEGEESHWYIQCDLDYSAGHPRAMLFWPSESDAIQAWRRLDPEQIAPILYGGADYVYTGNPIPLPKALADMRPAGLSDDAFRLGFFRIE